MIRLDDVRKSYEPGAFVLRGVSLSVAAGERVAIVGASGSGKSTLLHVIGGLDRAFEGEVEVAGFRLASLSDAALARFRNERVGFVFQAFNLLAPLTVLENVLLPTFFAAEPLPGAEARAREVLARVGLAGKEGRLPAKLSGGERQRVAIARALLRRPALILADEPTGALDAATGAEVIDLFRELNERDGITLVVVTHEERVARAASRVLRIEDGKLVELDRAAAAGVTR